jgi:predicted nuclease of predicted toxin-antitoxin system
MKFLLDHDVYAITANFLRELGYDVIQVSQIGLYQAKDEELLQKVQELNRIFVTRDRDFGRIVFIDYLGTGVIYLRMLPSTQNAIHKELEKILKSYSFELLKSAFIVVEPSRHRFRKRPTKETKK